MTTVTVGIDIAKETFDAALLRDGQYDVRQFSNDQAGCRQLYSWLKKQKAQKAHACMEATGRYGDDLAHFLHERGCPVSVVNPARLKAYANSKLKRVKTDREDARLLADFCATQQPDLWSPPPAEVVELKALTRHAHALKDERQRARNRLQAKNPSAAVQKMLKEQLAFLNKQIKGLEKQIQAHIKQYPELHKKQKLLTSIPGIALKTAAIILAELPDVDNFAQAGQVAAFAGLTPRISQSGTSVYGRSKLTKTGNVHLRTAFFMPALVAIRHNPLIKALAARLGERGKAKMSIVGAAMRKLLHLAYGVLKTGKPFDPDYSVNVQVTP